MAATTSDRILDAFGSRQLSSSPTAISRLAWRPTSPTDRIGLLATAAIVGISTWRTGVATIWIASIEDNASSTNDLHATYSKTNIIM
jgi:hypothetical protein